MRKRKGEYLVGDGDVFTIADIAVACAVANIEFANPRPGWRENFPALEEFWKHMEEKESFRETRPYMFDLKTENVVRSSL